MLNKPIYGCLFAMDMGEKDIKVLFERMVRLILEICVSYPCVHI